MDVVYAEVDWRHGWANDPNLRVLVDKMPDLDDLRYEKKDELYYAELGGYVNFFSWNPERDGKGRKEWQGFGGAVFPITLTNGEKVTLRGPWSSRAGVMNSVGFGPCVEVSLTEDEKAMERGYTFFASAISLDLANKAASYVDNVEMIPVAPLGSTSEVVWIPHLAKNGCEACSDPFAAEMGGNGRCAVCDHKVYVKVSKSAYDMAIYVELRYAESLKEEWNNKSSSNQLRAAWG